MMNRRGLLTAGIATSFTATVTEPAFAQIGQTLRIEAPDDVKVEKMSTVSGTVKKGQLLFQLHSFNIQRFEIHLELFQQHIDILERPFKDGRIDAEIDLLKKKAELLSDVVQRAQTTINRINIAIQMGLATDDTDVWTNPFTIPTTTKSKSFASTKSSTAGKTLAVGVPTNGDSQNTSETTQDTTTTQESTTNSYIQNPNYKSLNDAQVELDKTSAEYLVAKIAADQADKRKDDALAKIKLARDRLGEHQKMLTDMRESLTIVAAADGTFSALVAEGSFAKKGHSLGELRV